MKLDRLKAYRMWDWWACALIALAVIVAVKPIDLTTVVYKIALVTLALVIAYHADRKIFARVRDRIDENLPRDVFSAARIVARALIVFAVVVGLTQGL